LFSTTSVHALLSVSNSNFPYPNENNQAFICPVCALIDIC